MPWVYAKDFVIYPENFFNLTEGFSSLKEKKDLFP